MEATIRVLVVGAGIGGLTAALALRQSGFDTHVYEQARVLREVGAGLALGANAVRVLHRLGLAEALRAVGVRSESWDFRDWQSGAVLGRVPLADAGEVRWGASRTATRKCPYETSSTRYIANMHPRSSTRHSCSGGLDGR